MTPALMWQKLKRRLRALFRTQHLEQELDDELRFHLEREVEQLRARGLDEREARRQALLAFGNVGEVKETARDVRGVRLLVELGQDLRYGLRMVKKAPAFTAVAVLSLALGIGANSALFSVVDSVLLSQLPVKEPERLLVFEWEAGVAFRNSGTSGYSFRPSGDRRRGSSSFHHRIFQTLRQQDSPLSHLFAFASFGGANLVADGQAEVASGQWVSGNYFDALGVRPALGRLLGESDDLPGAAPAVMLSHSFWESRFAADRHIVGKRIEINRVPFITVGVTPPGFSGSLQVDSRPAFFLPIAHEPRLLGEGASMNRKGTGSWWLNLMGRLNAGATRPQAQESLNGAFQSLALEMMPPPRREGDPAQLEVKDYPRLVARDGSGGMTEARRQYSSSIYLLLGVVALVLLIACANVANMLLARLAARRQEITVRLAMGARRGRLVRQLLTEGLLLSTMAGLAGLGLALVGMELLAAMGSAGFLPSKIDYRLSGTVLGGTFLVALVTAVIFGLAPALRATRVDLTSSLKQGSRTTGGLGQSRLSRALVVVQVAMSLVLLVGAGLFLRTVQNLQTVAVGFNKEQLLVFSLRPGTLGYEGERLAQLYRQLFARLEALPGVRAVTFGKVRLLASSQHTDSIILPGETERTPRRGRRDSNRQIVRANYFTSMEITLLRGRPFVESDGPDAPRVAVVNQAFVRTYMPGREVIGQRIGIETPGQMEIVGVVADTKYNRQREAIAPLLFTHWAQELDHIRLGDMSFAVRTTGEPLALAPAVREVVRQVEPNLPVTGVTTQTAQAEDSVAAERMLARLLSFFGMLAVLLAAIGLYGVMAYSVAQRTTEIGIRMALGARATNVLWLVGWQGLRFALLGVVLGAAAALAASRVVASQLYGVGASDPGTFAAVAAVLVGAALLACWLPARRATRVDPVIALRSE